MRSVEPITAKGLLVSLIVGLSTIIAGLPARAAINITAIGTLPGGTYCSARAINADGSAVAGNADTTSDGGGERAFRWTVSGGTQSLGTLPGGASSSARGISSDGSVITGESSYSGGTHAFRWTVAGMVDIGELSGGASHWSGGHALSADGSTIVGNSNSSVGFRGFRWRTVGGIESLNALPGGFNSDAHAVSADGSVVAGLSDSPGGNRAFRWTSGTGMVSLGVLPGGSTSYAWAMNADGSVIIGKSDPFGQTVPFRWTSAGGGNMQNLGLLPGSPYASAHGVSGDGSIVVGVSAQPGWAGYHAFMWTPELGMVDLNTYLPTRGLDLSGWTLSQAYGVSADGTAIIGDGFFNGQSRGWVVRGLSTSCTAPQISSHPASAGVCGSGGASFSVAGSGGGPLSTQWRIESPANSGTYVPLTGPIFTEPASGLSIAVLNASASTVTLSNVQLGSHPNAIRVVGVVINSCGSATSNPATLTRFVAGSGDGDLNGTTNGADIRGMVQVLLNGGIAGASYCAYDMNTDGVVNAADLTPFIALLVN